MGLRAWLKRVRCEHLRQMWIHDIYGDEINHAGGMRSVWQCEDCGAYLTREELSHDYERGETTEEITVYHWMNERRRAELGLD
jgi:hypothetical protein